MKVTIATSLSLVLLAGSALALPPADPDRPEQRITIKVTSKGFEPAMVRARVGRPVVLVVTRTTEKTCAKELVVADRKIRQPLPLNHAVEIRLTPRGPGKVRFACGMNMVTGTIQVE